MLTLQHACEENRTTRMVVQIITDHLLCQGHYQALAMQTEAVPALRRLTAYIGVQQTYSAKGQRTNVVSFGGHPASVAPTQLLCGDRKAGIDKRQMN